MGRKGAVWMGFAFKEIDPHTYFPTRKTALAKTFQNMQLGQTQTMVWGSEKERWDATLFVVGTEKEVQSLIDDLIDGTVLYSDLNLDQPQVEGTQPKKPAKRGRKPKAAGPSIGAWDKKTIKEEKPDDGYPKTPAKRGRPRKAAPAIGAWENKVIKVEKPDDEAVPKRPRLNDEARPAEEVNGGEEEARVEETGENVVVEQDGEEESDEPEILGQRLVRPPGQVINEDEEEEEGHDEAEEEEDVENIEDEEEQTEAMRRFRAAEARVDAAERIVEAREAVLEPLYQEFREAKRVLAIARLDLEEARKIKDEERRAMGLEDD
ncbi:hypothetical protein PRIPAC_97221 [Pristionchus pacificus]|uniref:Uncharacterized protein n=1 Tax=Pristionchus pacificus TaxID=54126 RepID=A0A454XYS3_PRIPA|nr:hypothetical protein PRIPAC_97221 [Pristionchus pacificus]|eukprot:PDM63347.1 hypothetical protein PRIPAC_53704 [Pristionchus pacificus]